MNDYKIPKQIFIFWHDWKEAPDIINYCIKKLYQNKSDYKIIRLDLNNYKNYVDLSEYGINLNDKKIFWFRQRFADYLRIALLYKYGGIWVDSSIVFWKDISWLIDKNDTCVLFENKHNRNSGHKAFECWFIACTKNNRYIKKVMKELFSMKKSEDIDRFLESFKKENIIIQENTNLKYHLLQNIFNKVNQKFPKLYNTIKQLNAEEAYSLMPNFPLYNDQFLRFSIGSIFFAYKFNRIVDNKVSEDKIPKLTKLVTSQRILLNLMNFKNIKS